MGGRDIPIEAIEAIACGMAVSSIVETLTKIRDRDKRFAVLHAAATCLGLTVSGVIVSQDVRDRQEEANTRREYEISMLVMGAFTQVMEMLKSRGGPPVVVRLDPEPEPEPEAGGSGVH